LPILNGVAAELPRDSCRVVNVSPALAPELIQRSPDTEWVEDKENKLRGLFRVAGTPTLFVVGTDGKIAQIIAGVPDHLETKLRSSLVKP
jgi:hypothetical protein